MDSVEPRATSPPTEPARIFRSGQRRRHLHSAPHFTHLRGGIYVFARSWLTTGVPRVVFRSLDWPKCCHVAETSVHCQKVDRPRFRALLDLCQLNTASFQRPIRCPGCRPRIGHPAPVRIDSAYSAAPLPVYAVQSPYQLGIFAPCPFSLSQLVDSRKALVWRNLSVSERCTLLFPTSGSIRP
jgi:hypothetical protein